MARAEKKSTSRTKSRAPRGDAPASMAMAFDQPADGVDFAPMDALDEFRRKKVLAFRIKWLKALEEGAQRELRDLEGSADNKGSSRSK